MNNAHTTVHSYLENLIAQYYGLNAKFTTVIAWGYQTLSIYMEDTTGHKYLIKRTYNSDKNIKNITKSINVENFMNNFLPTPLYIKNTHGDYITHYGDEMIRLQHFIEGVPPFDMTWDIFEQALVYLKAIHSVNIETAKLAGIDLDKIEIADTKDNWDNVFLHGDLTPSNILVSHGKISALLDFEYACIGPKEYDVSRLCTFSSYHMEGKLSEFLDNASQFYKGDLNKRLFLECSKMHLRERLENLIKHKEAHEDQSLWKMDTEITEGKLAEVTALSQSHTFQS